MNLYRELAKILDVDESLISRCPKPEMGDLSLPCFVLAKKEGVAPAEIMPRYEERARKSELVADVKPMGAYLNFFINARPYKIPFGCGKSRRLRRASESSPAPAGQRQYRC